MGKMKDLSIELRNQELDNGPEFDSAGFSDADNQLPPPPDEININTNISLWVIAGHRISAKSYMEALQIWFEQQKFKFRLF
jgi:hypothetical protein